MSIDLFQEAVKATHNGNQEEAYQLLQELLLGQPRHELGWLWLSRVSPDLDEQIHALETALILNPQHKEAATSLQALKEKQQLNGNTEDEDLYKLARTYYKEGRPYQAHRLLQELVLTNPLHEKGWLGLGRLGQTTEEKIVALETAVALNPHNKKAVAVLQKLKIDHEDKLALAKVYEQYRQPDKALAAYKFAIKNAASSVDKHIAKKNYQKLMVEREQQAKIAQAEQKVIKVTHTNITLLRLALGPLIIYGLLSLIHGGLNPLRIPLVIYLGSVGVIIGSLLIVGTANTPHHPFWQKLLGPAGITDNPTRSVMAGIGLLLILIPFAIMFINSLNRLSLFRQALSATIH